MAVSRQHEVLQTVAPYRPRRIGGSGTGARRRWLSQGAGKGFARCRPLDHGPGPDQGDASDPRHDPGQGSQSVPVVGLHDQHHGGVSLVGERVHTQRQEPRVVTGPGDAQMGLW